MAAKKKGGLGRGLDALITPVNQAEINNKEENKTGFETQGIDREDIPEQEKADEIQPETSGNNVIMIRLEDLEPNTAQPRQNFDEESLSQLADSIRQHGIIQPLIVQKENGYYTIIAGERRWRAARMAGLTEVPAIIKEYTPMDSMEIALIENLQREDLNPIEEANAYKKLISDYGLKQEEAAEKVSKSRTAVTNSLRLLNLDDRVKQMVADEMITGGHARALLAVEDPELQYTLAMRIFDNKLSVRETEKLIKSITSKKTAKNEKNRNSVPDAVYRDVEDKIKEIMGTKVTIHASNKEKGRIEIEYYSAEDLDRIISMLESIR